MAAVRLMFVECGCGGFTPVFHQRGDCPLIAECVPTMDEAMDSLFLMASANISDFLDQLQREAA